MELFVKPLARDVYALHKIMTICGMIGVKYLHKVITPAGSVPATDFWTLVFDERARKKTTALARICRNVGARLVLVSVGGLVEYNHEDDD